MKYYSTTASDVIDASNHQELFLVFRYVLNEEFRKVFVDFIQAEIITSQLAQSSRVFLLLTCVVSVMMGLQTWVVQVLV